MEAQQLRSVEVPIESHFRGTWCFRSKKPANSVADKDRGPAPFKKVHKKPLIQKRKEETGRAKEGSEGFCGGRRIDSL